jgi:hypothetical protein
MGMNQRKYSFPKLENFLITERVVKLIRSLKGDSYNLVTHGDNIEILKEFVKLVAKEEMEPMYNTLFLAALHF